MRNNIYTNKNGQIINLTLYYFKIELKHYTEAWKYLRNNKSQSMYGILNPFLMEMSCELCPVFVFRSSLSVPLMLSWFMNVTDNSWTHCDPLYMCMLC